MAVLKEYEHRVALKAGRGTIVPRVGSRFAWRLLAFCALKGRIGIWFGARKRAQIVAVLNEYEHRVALRAGRVTVGPRVGSRSALRLLAFCALEQRIGGRIWDS